MIRTAASTTSSLPQTFALGMMMPSESSAFLTADNAMLAFTDEGGSSNSIIGSIFPSIFGGILLLAVGAFLYANVVYTPEIIEQSEKTRLGNREIEMRKLLEFVQTESKGNDSLLEELRSPLEQAFGMTIEEYVSKVDNEKRTSPDQPAFANADAELANVLRPICRDQ